MNRYTVEIRSLSVLAAALCMLCGFTTVSAAATTQTITLRPGWNAVYLEVQPAPRDPATVFRDLPVESVWTWFDRTSSVEFIRDPADGLWAQPGWSVYVKSPDKAAATNLFSIFANRAYLVKLGGRQNVVWTVSGTPATDKISWTSNSFNLVGFQVNPINPPTFAELLSTSSAHNGQPIYRLSPQGEWLLIENPLVTTIQSGEAYWVYCNGPSTYQSPVNVQVIGGELNYGLTADMNAVTLINDSSLPRTVTVKFQPPDSWLTYQLFNVTTGYNEYPQLDTWELQISAGRQTNIWLAVRRELLPAGISEGVLEITDEVGSRFMIPVKAEKQ